MSLLNNSLLLGAPAAAGGYSISRSLRFNSADSAYLSRTPASAGNRKTWTWAGWVKRSGSNRACLFSGGTTTSDAGFTSIEFESDGTLRVTGWNTLWAKSNALYRDYSAWYHVCVAFDSTQASAANQIKIYVNGSQITKATENALSQNSDYGINQAARHTIGAISEDANASFNNFYLAEVFFIDGSALTPSSFTETDATTDQLIPKAYSGSYGTNGFRLDFSNNASTTTLGEDAAGSNDWTLNNFSVTAGAGNDSLVDVPTNGAQTDTGVGGEVRGNYATLNPIAPTGGTTSNGNLQIVTNTSGLGNYTSSFGMSTGKWYAEAVATAMTYTHFGLIRSDVDYSGSVVGNATNTAAYRSNDGIFRLGNTNKFTGATFTTNDVIGLAFDADAGSCAVYKNGSLQGTATGFSAGTWLFAGSDNDNGSSATHIWNFGQRAFAYTAPSGYKALCTANLPAPTIVKPSTVMDVKLYTGNGSTQTISGLGFSPDLVWLKGRSNADNNSLYDTIRGSTKELASDSTGAEGTYTAALTSFDSTGFSLGAASWVNGSSKTYAAWTWDAGSSTVTNNTSGTITPTGVRANATAGTSVVTYTGNNTSGATVGHGLGVAPALIIVKRRDVADDWLVYHSALGATKHLLLNSTAAEATGSNRWNSTAPTSTVFSLGSHNSVNGNGTYVAYCFAPVTGMNAFGSYTGNGSSDGPFVWTGMRPRWILIKRTNAVGYWGIWDTARDTFNVSQYRLGAHTSATESSGDPNVYIDILSNGFKPRNTDTDSNGSASTYIYAAFAESPFNYSRAR